MRPLDQVVLLVVALVVIAMWVRLGCGHLRASRRQASRPAHDEGAAPGCGVALDPVVARETRTDESIALVAPVPFPSQQAIAALRAFDFAQAHGVLLRWDSRWPERVVLWGRRPQLDHVVTELGRVGFLRVLPRMGEA